MKAEGCSGLVERVAGSAALSSQQRTGFEEEKFTSAHGFQRFSPSRQRPVAGWSSLLGRRACRIEQPCGKQSLHSLAFSSSPFVLPLAYGALLPTLQRMALLE